MTPAVDPAGSKDLASHRTMPAPSTPEPLPGSLMNASQDAGEAFRQLLALPDRERALVLAAAAVPKAPETVNWNSYLLVVLLVVLGALSALTVPDCGRKWAERKGYEVTRQNVFVNQCHADGKSITDCTVLWEQVGRRCGEL